MAQVAVNLRRIEHETKWMTFRLIEEKPKTTVWSILNKSSEIEIGRIAWYAPFRQYCFFTTNADAVFNIGCIADITAFIEKLMQDRRAER